MWCLTWYLRFLFFPLGVNSDPRNSCCGNFLKTLTHFILTLYQADKNLLLSALDFLWVHEFIQWLEPTGHAWMYTPEIQNNYFHHKGNSQKMHNGNSCPSVYLRQFQGRQFWGAASYFSLDTLIISWLLFSLDFWHFVPWPSTFSKVNLAWKVRMRESDFPSLLRD